MTLEIPAKVVFHIGLNKAGSSYLQELFSHNFSHHGSNGIFYPTPHLRSGNAGAFAHAIQQLDKTIAMEKLGSLLEKAEPGETVLLSTEYMYHQFVQPAQRDLFHACFSQYGIEDLTLVCMFRNIYAHAVSAYCHRCGAHAIPPFDQWIVETAPNGPDFVLGVNCYEFWTELRHLLSAARDGRFNLCYLPYSKMMEQDWEDLLGTSLSKPDRRAVNVSVCPSEAEVLRRLRDAYGPEFGELRKRFKVMSKREKADSSSLLNHNHALISDQLRQHVDMISEAETIFGFDISSPPASLSPDNSHGVTLSELQLDTLIGTLSMVLKTTPKKNNYRIRDTNAEPWRSVFRRIYRAIKG